MRRTSPSIASAAPNSTPARMHSSVRVPIARAGGTSSVAGSFDVRRKSVSAEVRRPGRDDAAEEDAVRGDAVVRRRGAEVDDDGVDAYRWLAASVLMMRSAPTVSGSSTSSTIGSATRASITRACTPSQRSHASTSGAVTAGTTEPIAAPVICARSSVARAQQLVQQEPELVRRALDGRRQSPMRAQVVAVEQRRRSFRCCRYRRPGSRILLEKQRATTRRDARPHSVCTSSPPRASMPRTIPSTGATHRRPSAQSRRSNSCELRRGECAARLRRCAHRRDERAEHIDAIRAVAQRARVRNRRAARDS